MYHIVRENACVWVWVWERKNANKEKKTEKENLAVNNENTLTGTREQTVEYEFDLLTEQLVLTPLF